MCCRAYVVHDDPQEHWRQPHHSQPSQQPVPQQKLLHHRPWRPSQDLGVSGIGSKGAWKDHERSIHQAGWHKKCTSVESTSVGAGSNVFDQIARFPQRTAAATVGAKDVQTPAGTGTGSGASGGAS